MVSERIQRRIDRLLDQIEESVDEGNWGLVRDLAAQALSFDAENADGIAFLAAAERALKDISGSHREATKDETVDAPAPSAPSQTLPASFKDGRYMVKGLLGDAFACCFSPQRVHPSRGV